MADMPLALVEALQANHPEHHITEYESRWRGFLIFARNGTYEGESHSITAMGTGEVSTGRFIDYVLHDREGRLRHGLRMRTWPGGSVSRPAESVRAEGGAFRLRPRGRRSVEPWRDSVRLDAQEGASLNMTAVAVGGGRSDRS